MFIRLVLSSQIVHLPSSPLPSASAIPLVPREHILPRAAIRHARPAGCPRHRCRPIPGRHSRLSVPTARPRRRETLGQRRIVAHRRGCTRSTAGTRSMAAVVPLAVASGSLDISARASGSGTLDRCPYRAPYPVSRPCLPSTHSSPAPVESSRGTRVLDATRRLRAPVSVPRPRADSPIPTRASSSPRPRPHSPFRTPRTIVPHTESCIDRTPAPHCHRLKQTCERSVCDPTAAAPRGTRAAAAPRPMPLRASRAPDATRQTRSLFLAPGHTVFAHGTPLGRHTPFPARTPPWPPGRPTTRASRSRPRGGTHDAGHTERRFASALPDAPR